MTFKIQYISGNRAWCYCLFHKDNKRPNLCISLDEQYYGKYLCWACGAKGKLSNKQMEELVLSKKKRRTKPVPINWESLSQKYFKNLGVIDTIKLMNLWDVESSALHQFRAGWDGEAYTFPMYNMIGSGLCITGIQRVWLDGRKKAVHGSQLGLFVPSDDNVIFIVEGISDAVVVYNLGFDVIGKPCATYGDKVIKELLLASDIHSVVIIPDNDEAGKKSTIGLIRELRGIVNCNMFEFDAGKDIREYIQIKGKQFVTDRLNQYV